VVFFFGGLYRKVHLAIFFFPSCTNL